MIDTHAHLNFEPLLKDLDGVLHRASKAGITDILVPGTNCDSSWGAVEMAKKSKDEVLGNAIKIHAAVGIHPLDGEGFTEHWVNQLREMKKSGTHITAIGEVGLDYYYFKEGEDPREIDKKKKHQQRIVQEMLDLALEWELPVILHSRLAHYDLYPIVKESGLGGRCVVHCFTGNYDEAKQWLDLGSYISLTGIITYKKNEALRQIVGEIPIERIMLETDAPYLAPERHRSELCEPHFVTEVAKCLAEIKGKSYENIELVTDATARRFFSL
jgi:TatD DNase family protein